MPIIIHSNLEQDKCPKCGCDEDKIEVCKNCGYEYPEGSTSGFLIFTIVLLVIVVILLFSVFVSWAIDHTSVYEPYTGTFV